MHPSSISNSKNIPDSKKVGNLNIWVPYWPIILIGIIVLGELLLRIPAIQTALPNPEPTLWHAELVPTKITFLKNFAADQGIDILFMGNSTMQAGINPEIFDQVRENTIDDSPGAFNGSIEGIPPEGNLLFLRIYLRQTEPKTIIYGITPQDLNSNSPWVNDVIARVKQAPRALAEARWGWKGVINAFLLEYSLLYRYRFVLHQLLLRAGNLPAPSEVYFDERGYHHLTQRLSDYPRETQSQFYNNAGVLNYTAEGKQLQSLRQLIKEVQQRNIDLIFINMPLADKYYDNFDSPHEDYTEYLNTIQALAQENSVPFWDFENVPDEEAFTDAAFSDLNHLNQYGAARLSQLVAEKLSNRTTLSAK